MKRDTEHFIDGYGIEELRSVISPFNKNEDFTSEPKLKVHVGFSPYSDIAYIDVVDKNGCIIKGIYLQITEDILSVNLQESEDEDEKVLINFSMKDILKKI